MTSLPTQRLALAQQAWPFADSALAELYDYCEYKRLPAPDDPPCPQPALMHLQYHHVAGEDTILNLGSLGFPEILSDGRISRAVDRLQPHWVSLHLGFSADRLVVLGQGRPTLADGPTLSRTETRGRILDNLTHLRSLFPGLPLLLENLDYMPPEISGAYEHVCEPEFITDLLAAAGCPLLLDLAHARVSAGNLGIPWADYLAALPLEAVRQVHLSRARQEQGMWIDAHLRITAEEVDEFAALLPSFPRCEVLTLETFGAPEDLAPQLALLQHLR